MTGCSEVSPGCAHCYARVIAERFWGGRHFHEVQCHPGRLAEPLGWRRGRLVFVNSMSDLFHEAIPFEFIDEVFAVMAMTPQHTYQILTKRQDRMLEYMLAANGRELKTSVVQGMAKSAFDWPLPNVWLGVSCENQKFLELRAPVLKQVPAAVRMLSVEPMLEHMDLAKVLGDGLIHWCIFGGESGKAARKCQLSWIRRGVEACKEAGVAPFVKQVGRNVFDGTTRLKILHSKGGDPAEWPVELNIREWPAHAIPRLTRPGDDGLLLPGMSQAPAVHPGAGGASGGTE